MTKTIDDYFRDWESEVFGYGYGTGEVHIVTALRRFLEHCTEGPYKRSYDYSVLEQELGATVAWLLINTLCHVNIVEYGTSPRYAWLTEQGTRLRDYMLSKTVAELTKLAPSDYIHCGSDYCNCDDTRLCSNPFFK